MGRHADPVRQVGDFILEDEIGRGGMGVVYRARHVTNGDRVVALKILPSLVGLDSSSVERFRREAQAAGRLEHPGIVPVLEVGAQEGVHYYAMELVEGPSLDVILDAVSDRTPGRLTGTLFEESGFDQVFPRLRSSGHQTTSPARYAASCARLARDLAAALAVAHRNGVVHRDVKPSNVLLRSSGQPVLVDFGLARDETVLGITQSGDAVGTPSYMSPEQARGDEHVDGRTDIYGLGATLYELLTLGPPFSGAHPAEIMRRIVEDSPPPVRSCNPRVPEALARIVERCLRKDPAARYDSMEALACDLEDFLRGREAATGAVAGRAWRRAWIASLVGRHRQAVQIGGTAIAASILAFLSFGVVVGVRQARDGAGALRAARDHLRDDLSLTRAEEAYGRAAVLLSPDAVAAARREHAEELFGELYARGLHDELRRYLEAGFDRSQRSEPWWRRLRRRAAGLGRLELHAGAESQASLRRYESAEVGLAAESRPWHAGEMLPIGEWFLVVQSPGLAAFAQRIVIERDEVSTVVPLRVAADRVPPGHVLVPFPDGDGGITIARTEWSQAELAACVETVFDRRLRDEIGAGSIGGTGRAGRLPARGLGWRAARALAAQVGMHVPSFEEFRLAATGGFPAPELAGALDWSRVVAAREGSVAAPVPVDTDLGRASPFGLIHAVGNVAELVAPAFGGAPLAVGGSFRCDRAEDLHVDAARAVAPDASPGDVGIRFATFVAPPDDPVRAAEIDAVLATADHTVTAVEDWSVTRRGIVLCEITVPAPSATGAPLPFRGFRVEDVRSTDGDDVQIRRPATAGVPWTVAGRERSRVSLVARLRPIDALYAEGAFHRLRIPWLTAGGARRLVRVRLPAGCRIDEVEPEPRDVVHRDGGAELVWDTDLAPRRSFATVRFRVDGSLATPWPAFGDGEAALIALLASRGVPAEPEFDFAPGGAVPDALDPGGRLELTTGGVEDVTAVGVVVAVFANVDWSGPPGRAIFDWPIHATFQRTDGELRPLSIGARVVADGGSWDGDVYRHERLGLRLDLPPGIEGRRSAAGPWPLQLHLTCAAAPGCAIEIRGIGPDVTARSRRGLPEVDRVEAVDRLAGGATFATAVDGGPVDLAQARPGTIGSARAPRECTVLERSFVTADGAARRERWYVIQRTSDWFRVRCVASGRTERAAVDAFTAAESTFFRPVVESISVADRGLDRSVPRPDTRTR